MQYSTVFKKISGLIRQKDPSSEIINKILSKYRDEDLINKYFNNKAWEENPFEGLEILISAIYENDEDTIKNLLNESGLSYDDLLEIALLSFDIAVIKKDNDVMTKLAHDYYLSWKQVSNSFITRLIELINEEKFEETVEFFNKNFDKIDVEKLNREGTKLFNEKVREIRRSQRKNYSIPIKIKNILKIPVAMTYPEIFEEYQFHMENKNYLIAAELSKEFEFPQNLILHAGFSAFKSEFEDFKYKIISGEYKETTDIGPNDPYKKTKEIIKEYDLLNLRISDEQHKTYIKKIAELVFHFLKELNYKEQYKHLTNSQKIIFSANLINDFRLTTDFFDTTIVLQTNEIIGKMLSNIDENLESLEDVKQYYNSLQKLDGIYTSYKEKVKKLASRIFDVYLYEEDIIKAFETFDQFDLEVKDVSYGIKEKCIKILAEDKINTLKEIVTHFKISQILEKNEKFMELLINSIEKYLKLEFYDRITSLMEMFEIPKEKLLPSVHEKIEENLSNKRFNEVLKVLNFFELEVKDIKKILLIQYDKLLTKDVNTAKTLRIEFALSIFDVGFFKWLIKEVLKIGVKKGSNKTDEEAT